MSTIFLKFSLIFKTVFLLLLIIESLAGYKILACMSFASISWICCTTIIYYTCYCGEPNFMCFTRNVGFLPWPGGSVRWSIVPYTKKLGFDPWSGHVQKAADQYLPVSPSHPPPHPLSSLSEISKHILGWGLKIN